MPKTNIYKIIAVLCVLAAGVLFLSTKDGEKSVLTLDEDTFFQEAEETETETVKESTILVHVCGAVANEGVYELPEGSRVADAVEAAGGFSEDADRTYLNLAEPLEDGEQVRIYTGEEAEQQRAKDEASADGLININTAALEELMTLPGIGEARAQAIIAYRNVYGDFQEISDIMKVSGIKEAAYAKLKDRIKTGS